MILLKCISSSHTNQIFFILSRKRFNKIPILTYTEDRRTRRVFEKLGPGGYFKVLVVLDSKAFKKYFALDCAEMSSSGRDNAKVKSVDGVAISTGNKGESRHSPNEHLRSESPQDESVEYIGTIRKEIRRILPCLPDLTLLRLLGGKVQDPVLHFYPRLLF